MRKSVSILGTPFELEGDAYYLGVMGDRFEPDTVALMALLCEEDAQVLDVGANIGLTALALSRIARRGRVAAVEPVPEAFSFLVRNLARAQVDNVKPYNFALGPHDGTVVMQGSPDFLAGSFVTTDYPVDIPGHFRKTVPMRALDSCFAELDLSRLDFVKLDVEGYELDVLEGSRRTLARFRPLVMLELNHWCLNVFRGIPLRAFVARLRELLPVAYAVDGPDFLDLYDERHFHHLAHEHVVNGRYKTVVAGYEAASILKRLVWLGRWQHVLRERELALAERQQALAERDRLASAQAAILASWSWRLTRPLRALRRLLGR